MKFNLSNGWHRIPGNHPIFPTARKLEGGLSGFLWARIRNKEVREISGWTFDSYSTMAWIRSISNINANEALSYAEPVQSVRIQSIRIWEKRMQVGIDEAMRDFIPDEWDDLLVVKL